MVVEFAPRTADPYTVKLVKYTNVPAFDVIAYNDDKDAKITVFITDNKPDKTYTLAIN